MKVNRQLTFLFLAFAALCIFLYAVSGILLPFVLGILVAYMLDPVVDRFEARKVPRGFSSAVVLAIFFSIIIATCVVVIPLIFQQVQGFATKLPTYINTFNHEIWPNIRHKLSHISPALAEQLDDKTKDISDNLGNVVEISLAQIFHSSLWLLNIASLILITPIVSFYLLRDWDVSLAKLYSLLPQNYAPVIKKQARRIDDTISAFMRGQLTVCFLIGIFYAAGLTIVGLNFGFLIGLITGILTFIPYVGPLVGALAGLTIAFLQFGDDWYNIALVAAIFIGGQNIESNFVTPKIVGDKIGVHPAWLIFSMLAGASLLGFLGVIIAVPMTAVIAVLVRFAVEQYEHSSYYIRNRNTEHLEQPLNYKAEPGSLLAIDEPPQPKRKRVFRHRKKAAKKAK